MSLGDRLALKRRFQVQKQTSLAKDAEVTQLESLSESSQAQNHTQVDERSTEKTNPVMDVSFLCDFGALSLFTVTSSTGRRPGKKYSGKCHNHDCHP